MERLPVVGGKVLFGRRPDAGDLFGDLIPRSVAFLTQPGLPASHAARLAGAARELGAEPLVLPVPDGEAAKSLEVAARVIDRLEEAGFERADMVVAVGGGAVTDFGGFVAGIYLRGVRCGLVPTTLLGAIDAAIGGKVAVNARGKNRIGLFRQPEVVIVDLDVLDQLPVHLVRHGLAEALKVGLVADPGLVDMVGAALPGGSLEGIVRAAITAKTAIVESDPLEVGRREILNFGHTIGHAVETVSGLPHGESVALGMVAEAYASAAVAAFSDAEAVRGMVAALGLPVAAPDIAPSALDDALGLDKKRRGAETRMVLLEAIGRPRVGVVGDATVRAALAAIGIGGRSP